MVLLDPNGNPLITTLEEQNDLEMRTWQAYLDNCSDEISQLFNYYRNLLLSEIKNHLKNDYRNVKQQREVIEDNVNRILRSFNYSLGKGHQVAFEWVRVTPIKLNIDDFGKLNFQNTILYVYQRSLMNPEIIEQTLDNDINSRYLVYLDTLTNDMYHPFMQVCRIMYYKGFLQGIKDIQHYFNIADYQVINSSLTKLPVNRDVILTPAMRGRFLYGDSHMETWGLKWDLSYSQYDYKNETFAFYDNMMMTVGVYCTTWHELMQRAQTGFISDKLAMDYFQRHSFDEGKPLLIIEYNFLAAAKNKMQTPRTIDYNEIKAIQTSLLNTFSNALQIGERNCCVIYND